MGKRFIDTSIWEKPWFQDLTPTEKCAFVYLFTKCDNVGLWQPNFKLADFQIGSEIDWDKLAEHSNGNLEILPTGKWWLIDFCDFQYGILKEECPPHRSYISTLNKHGLLKRVLKGYSKGNNSPQEKEKEKDKEKELEKEKDIAIVLKMLNQETNSNYRNMGKTREIIIARLNDGYTHMDLQAAVLAKARDWMGDEKMEKYLRPQTLFNKSKIDGYIAEYERGLNDGKN